MDPGVDITPGTVIVATPFVNLRDRAYWVTRDLEGDTFTIRMSNTRGTPTPFGWVIVENDMLREAVEAAAQAAADAQADAAEE
ncbi:MAG: hypothetical protein AB1Z66_08145 [Candidatus Limnocylindrales bacterium]